MIMSKAPPKLSNTLDILVTQNNLSLTKHGTRRSTRRFEQITAQIKRLLVTECWIQMFDLDQKPFQCKVLSRDYENGQTCSAIQNSLSMSLDKNV